MTTLTDKWLAIPELPYIALILLFGVLGVVSVIALIIGAVKKKKAKHFILWGVVLLVSAAYLDVSLNLGWIVANTMIGG